MQFFFLTSPHYLSQYLIVLFLFVMFLLISWTSFAMLLSMCINDLSPLSLSFIHTQKQLVCCEVEDTSTGMHVCVCEVCGRDSGGRV